ncbi:hypothetical protein [Deinococcus roseus]|uniref:Uncharacterized protein n=1 Tax=Deinococcus roseus TaxID=392414 RepID=A0ABQ2DF91_9DEIO|nr:hypothetical protein [Deinococcus roseus]GGJ53800.1 hypothetical protein GCM10008938_44770 [Deinococcus roseus]
MKPIQTMLWQALMLTAALLWDQAAAQTTQNICDLADEGLEVSVGKQSRGLQFMRRTGNEVWLTRETFKPGEEGYTVQALTCEGITYLKLSSQLDLKLDFSSLILNLSPNFALLSRREVNIEPVAQQDTLDVLLLQMPFSAALRGTGILAESLSGSFAVAPVLQYSDFTFSASSKLGYNRLLPEGWTVTEPSAKLAWQFDPAGTAQLIYQNPPLTVPGRLSGVQVGWHQVPPRIMEPIILQLPLESQVQVFLEGELLYAGRQLPGTLQLKGIVLPRKQGEVRVDIRDSTGRSIQRFAFADTGNLTPDEWQLWGEAGWWNSVQQPDLPVVGFRASYHLASNMLLTGQAHWAPGDWSASTQLYQTSEGEGAMLGLTLKDTFTGPLAVEGQGTYTQHWGPVFLRLNGEGNFPDWNTSRLGLGLGFQQNQWKMYGQAQYQLSGAFSGGVGAELRITPDLLLSGNLNWTGSDRRPDVRVGLRWNPTSNSEVSLQHAGRLQGSARIQWSESLETQVSADAQMVQGSVQYKGPVNAQLAVNSSQQWQSAVSGTLTVAGDQVTLGDAPVAPVALLLHTGQPDLPIRLNGEGAGRTNAAGDLLITGLRVDITYNIAVDPNTLPIELGVQNVNLSVRISRQGILPVDWKSNFVVSRWITFFWNPQEKAAGAALQAAGQTIYLDDEGQALLPPSLQGVTGRLVLEDRFCAVTLSTADQVMCQENPAASSAAP